MPIKHRTSRGGTARDRTIKPPRLASSRPAQPSDYVDCFIAEWEARRPDLRMRRLAPLMRVLRLSGLLEKDLAVIAKEHAITTAQFQVLAALRRRDPQPLSLTELTRVAILTSGSMTSLVDRLEDRGLVWRHPHPEDRRGVLVALTEAGRNVIDSALQSRIAQLHRLAESCADIELERVSAGLRRLLLVLEGAYGGSTTPGRRRTRTHRRRRVSASIAGTPDLAPPPARSFRPGHPG